MTILEKLLGSGHHRFWTFIEERPLLRKLFKFHWEHKLIIPGLRRDYAEPADIILYGAFEGLQRFLDDPWTKHVYWYSNSRHKKVWQTALKLHYWWTVRRPARIDPIDTIDFDIRELSYLVNNRDDPRWLIWEKACADSTIFDEECYREDQSMLKRLIHIRRELWS